MANNNPVTDNQKNFIHSLAGKKVLPSDIAERVALIDAGTVAQASALIDTLKALPWKPRNAGDEALAVLAEALGGIEKSFYAIPADEAERYLGIEMGRNDYLFVEVRERNKRRYMNRLHGSVGFFRRSRLSVETIKGLSKVIARNPLEYATNFADIFSVCGCCGANLTDPVSRELKFGPECRKRFERYGLKVS